MPDSTEGFLGRWSRLKKRAKTTENETPLAAPIPAEDATPDVARTAALPLADEARAEPVDSAGTADVVPEALPPVESLGAESDYTAYLAPGVPDSVKLAALRKAWCSDPKIADFRGFAEYDWDCNAPGYGQLLPADNIQELLSNFFREEEPEKPEAAPAVAEAAGEEADGTPPAETDPDTDGLDAEPPDGHATDGHTRDGGVPIALAPPGEASLPAPAPLPEGDPERVRSA